MEKLSPVPDSDVMACIASLVATHGPQMADQSRREALRLLLYVTMPDHEAQIEQTIAYLNQNPARQAGAVTSVAATPDPAIAPGKGSAPRHSGPPPTSQQPDAQFCTLDAGPAAEPHPGPARRPPRPAAVPVAGHWRDPVLDTPPEQRLSPARTCGVAGCRWCRHRAGTSRIVWGRSPGTCSASTMTAAATSRTSRRCG